jgi:hypothetical protein
MVEKPTPSEGKYTIYYRILPNAVGNQHAFAVVSRKRDQPSKMLVSFCKKNLLLLIARIVEREATPGCLA